MLKRSSVSVRTLPDDLVAIGSRLHDWPHDEPLDKQECRTALWLAAGNITRAAVLLRTNSARLGNFVRRDSYLAEERANAAELAVDRAEAVILEALDEEDVIRRDDAAKFVLMHAGRARGWSRDGTAPNVNMSFGPGAAGAVQIRWQTEADMKTIEHREEER